MVAGCDPALPLLATPLGLLDPPVAFAWWQCGSGEALRLAAAGLVHAAGVHLRDASGGYNATAARRLPGGAEVVGFTAWREGLLIRPELADTIAGLDGIVKHQLRMVNREPGAEARRLLDRERERLGLDPAELAGYDTRAGGHLQVASAVAAGLADAGVASEPAARAYDLEFVPLADERFDLVLPARAPRLPRGAGAAEGAHVAVAAGPAREPARIRRRRLRRTGAHRVAREGRPGSGIEQYRIATLSRIPPWGTTQAKSHDHVNFFTYANKKSSR